MRLKTTSKQLEAVQIFIDFLATHPSDEEILKFELPEKFQTRIQELITKNNAGTITERELRELQEYERLDTYGSLLKTKIATRPAQERVTV